MLKVIIVKINDVNGLMTVEAAFNIFKAHLLWSCTSVYIPGLPGKAHPYPCETIPVKTLPHTNGPPESP